MEERIVKYIRENIEKGNVTAYNILINIAKEMILNFKSEEQIKARIDELITEPFKG